MLRFTAMLALTLPCIGLTGCAMEWSRAGTTEQEMNADKLTCEQQAARLYPVVHDPSLTYRPAASSKLDTSCVQQTGFNNCDAAGNAAPAAAGAPNDANAYDRAAAVKACLVSKGYSYKSVTH
jgi:hypothetical protein